MASNASTAINGRALGGLVDNAQVAIVITDPRLDDNPIVYVNDAFVKMTLYSREFAMGRNCRFLQGKETRESDIEDVRECVRKEKECTARILNYRADGTTFLNELTVAPVHDSDGRITAFFGVQRELPTDTPRDGEAGEETQDDTVTPQMMLREIQHRVKNHLAMIVSLIRLQSKRPVTRESLEALSHRIEALALLYDELLHPGVEGENSVAGGAYLSRIATVLAGIGARPSIRLNIDCEPIVLELDPAARLGLLLTELLTNAYEHAFEGRDCGCVTVRLRQADNRRVELSVEDDGVGLPEGSNWPHHAQSVRQQREAAEETKGELDTTGDMRHAGMGGSIVLNLTKILEADLDVASGENGTKVTVRIANIASPSGE